MKPAKNISKDQGICKYLKKINNKTFCSHPPAWRLHSFYHHDIDGIEGAPFSGYICSPANLQKYNAANHYGDGVRLCKEYVEGEV